MSVLMQASEIVVMRKGGGGWKEIVGSKGWRDAEEILCCTVGGS